MAREGRLEDYKLHFFDVYYSRSWCLCTRQESASARSGKKSSSSSSAPSEEGGASSSIASSKEDVLPEKPGFREERWDRFSQTGIFDDAQLPDGKASEDEEQNVVLDFATMLKSQFAEQDGDTLSPEACRERVNEVPQSWSKSVLTYGLQCCAAYKAKQERALQAQEAAKSGARKTISLEPESVPEEDATAKVLGFMRFLFGYMDPGKLDWGGLRRECSNQNLTFNTIKALEEDEEKAQEEARGEAGEYGRALV